MDRFKTPVGNEGEYYYHENIDSANVFAQAPDGRFVMIREYRYLFDTMSITQAMGGIEEGETPEESAVRELREELGYETGELILVGTYASSPSFSKEKVYTFLARDLKLVGTSLEGHEDIEPVFMEALEIEEAIAKGEIWDSHAITGWHFIERYLRMH